MAIQIGRMKCCLCKGKRGFFHSVHAYGCYGDVGKRYYYHPECLELVEMYPEQHEHRVVDMAIEISDRKKDNIKGTNDNIIKDHQKKIEKLKTNHFERMMPSE